MTKFSKALPIWIGVCCALPIFFAISGTSIQLAPRNISSERLATNIPILPLSQFLLPIFLTIVVLTQRIKYIAICQPDLFAFGYFGVMTFSLLVGRIFFNEETRTTLMSFVLYCQTILPVAWYAVGRSAIPNNHLGVNERAHFYLAFLKAIAFTAFGCLLLFLIQTAISGGSDYRYSMISDHIGPFYNYKIKKFYSPLLVMASCIGLGVFLFQKQKPAVKCIYLGVAVLCGAGTCMVWARTGIVTLIVGWFVLGVIAFYMARVNHAFLIRSCVIAVIVTAGIMTAVLSGSQSVARMADTLANLSDNSGELEGGDTRRFAAMWKGVEIGIFQPLGSMFQIVQRGIEDRTFTTENGFLDLAVRGGPFAMAAFTFLAVYVVFLLFLQCKTRIEIDGGFLIGAMAGLFAICFVGNFWLNLATEPYISAIMWACLGTSVSFAYPRAADVTNKI